MYTQCPQCLTIFAIDEDALQASLGIVHCGQCGQRFDALRTLSNSLPAKQDTPLAERDVVASVPTLTEAVTLAATMPGSAMDGASAPPESEDAIPSAHDPQGLDAGSDWFADFENELTLSLLSEATHAFPDEQVAGYAWQVDELPAQASYAVPDISTIFWGSAADLDTPDAMTGDGLSELVAGSDDRNAPATSEPTAFPPSSPSADGSAETIRGELDSVFFEESALSLDPDALQPPVAESMVESLDPTGLDPGEAGAEPAAPDETPPANMLLAHEAAESDIAKTADMATDTGATAATVPDPAEPFAPVYVRPRSHRAAGVAWVLGCLALAIVLAAQLAWIKRVDLLRNPATHAWTARACQVIACRLPPIRDVAKLELVSRDVRPDPHTRGALMITATVRNDASFRQPWPVVVVELTDLDNNTVAMRRFRPTEYMPDAAMRAAGIAAGATSALAFEVADPGRRAIAFRFSFE